MIILGIETSTNVCSVGLARPGMPLKEQRVVEQRIHSEKLPALVRSLLSGEGITMNRLGAIAVSIGPGSFTGLRIGLSAAKGLCFALNIPLIAVPTFDAVAHGVFMAHPDAENILVALDAKKGDFYAGRFKKQSNSPLPAGGTSLRSEDDVRREIRENPPAFFVTDREDLFRDAGKRTADVHTFCRGDIVAQIGLSMAEAKQFSNAESLEPMYLKDFVVIGRTSAV